MRLRDLVVAYSTRSTPTSSLGLESSIVGTLNVTAGLLSNARQGEFD